MKKTLYSLVFLSLSIYSYSQWQVNVIDLATNDLVYDTNTNKIYASIPSSNGSNGNSLGVINPENITLENTVYIGSEPTVLAISDNGQYIYSGFDGASMVRRFNVETQSAEIQFSLGTDPSSGAFYAEDIEVMPEHPETIAVSRRNQGVSPRHEGVAIYDNGTVRPTTTEGHTGSNKIEFSGENSLIGYNNESTEFGIRKLNVTNGGVSNTSVYQYILQGFGLDFIYNDNRMYATNGVTLDTSNTPFIIGNFSNANGPVAYDSNKNVVCYVTYDWGEGITFKRFNPDTFLLVDELEIEVSFSQAKSLITCGAGCYAFNTMDNKVIILKDTSMGTDEYDNYSSKIYPNPAKDWFSIDSKNEISQITIYDLSGKLIYKNNTIANDEKINTSKFSKGTYLVQIQDSVGKKQTLKLIVK